MKNCLTIAGSDCSGGAGIQADLKTFSALGTFGMSVVSAVVAENTSRVISIQDIDVKIIEDQIDAVFEDIEVAAVKVGMLPGIESMRAVAAKLREYRPPVIVMDPVMVATGGGDLMKPEALGTLKRELIPVVTLLTPNIPEAEIITGTSIRTQEDMKAATVEIHRMGAQNVLIKGGHLEGEAYDLLYDGVNFYSFSAERIDTRNTHGTGCTLSSAITANLAKGMDMPSAVAEAKRYLTEAIRHGLAIGKGHGPTNHFHEFYRMN